ncbi:hypothetical protein V6N13_141144 [Hibiscus sabdariffa]
MQEGEDRVMVVNLMSMMILRAEVIMVMGLWGGEGGDNGVVICRMDITNEQYDASKNGDLSCMALATEGMDNVEIHDGFCLKNGCNDVFCCPPKRVNLETN